MVAFLCNVREGCSEKITFWQKSLGDKFVGRIFQAKKISLCKTLMAGILGLLETSEEETVSIAEGPHER